MRWPDGDRQRHPGGRHRATPSIARSTVRSIAHRIDGKSYAIRFRLRMPTATWNERFYMGGGGGTTARSSIRSCASPKAMPPSHRWRPRQHGQQRGHGRGTAAFGVDPQARVDFAYNATTR